MQSDEEVDFPSYSPTTNTPLQFQNDEGAELLKKCWYAGVMAPRKDDHMILGNQICDNDLLLRRCFLHGVHASSCALKKEPIPNASGLLAKCLSVGLFVDKNNQHPKKL